MIDLISCLIRERKMQMQGEERKGSESHTNEKDLQGNCALGTLGSQSKWLICLNLRLGQSVGNIQGLRM